ncbi:Uncharacterized protein TCM_043470 [Theobroma cacao]|uniref:Uncharacterized protein n=1 Tax=Theobroma cacao TaxID=3641 RepID=A0A061FQJ8_THECC|nr:Uncharacterized protein TCM_043470 [Theobroma cacao]
MNCYNYQWPSEQFMPRRVASEYELNSQVKASILEKKPTLKKMFMQHMANMNVVIQRNESSTRNIETHVSQLINDINNRAQEILPNDIEPNPRGEEYGKHFDEVNGKNVVDDGDQVDQKNLPSKQIQD